MLYFIVNKKSRSGRGADTWREVEKALRDKKVRYEAWCTEYAGHARKLAGRICEREDEDICLVVVGGDGTANEAINGIAQFDRVRFGMIPTGSGNDFARGLKMKGSPVQILEEILACVEQGPQEAYRMDLGRVCFPGGEPRLFAISSGVGLDAIVCKKALQSGMKDFLNRLHLGKLTYLFLTVQSLFSMETSDAVMRPGNGHKILHRKAICFAAMNFRAEGGGVPMAPLADATDGKLSVCSIFGIPRWRTFFCLPLLVAAKHSRIRGFSVTDCGKCEIRLKQKMVLHADGEYCGEVSMLRFFCLPGKLRVLRKR